MVQEKFLFFGVDLISEERQNTVDIIAFIENVSIPFQFILPVELIFFIYY